MSDLQPVGWQYRFKHGDWTSWINIPVNLDDFTRIQKDSLKKGAVELRPIYSGDQVEQLRNQLVKAQEALRRAQPIISDRAAGGRMIRPREEASEVFYLIQAVLTDDHQSAPVTRASHNSGEGDPAVTPDCAGAGTCAGEEAIKSAANEAAPGAAIVRRDGDLHVYYAGFNLSKFVRFLALTSAYGTIKGD